MQAWASEGGSGIKGTVVFKYPESPDRAILEFQFGGEYEADATIAPGRISHAVTRLDKFVNGLTYSVNLKLADP